MTIASLRGSKLGVQKATINRGLFDGAEKTHCELKAWFFACQKHFAQLQIPIKVVYGWRSFELQEDLYAKGRTHKRGGHSPHNHGFALDIIHAERGWNLTQREWVLMASIMLEIAERRGLKLRWGGDWNQNGVPVPDDPEERFWDAAHFEIADWKTKVNTPCADPLCNGQCKAMGAIVLPYAEPQPDPVFPREPKKARVGRRFGVFFQKPIAEAFKAYGRAVTPWCNGKSLPEFYFQHRCKYFLEFRRSRRGVGFISWSEPPRPEKQYLKWEFHYLSE